MARFLYFAMVREKIGRGTEDIPLPPSVTRVGAVIPFLRQKGSPYDQALDGPHLRLAVNQRYAQPDDPVGDGDEIAIFPPVSGG